MADDSYRCYCDDNQEIDDAILYEAFDPAAAAEKHAEHLRNRGDDYPDQYNIRVNVGEVWALYRVDCEIDVTFRGYQVHRF